MSRLVRAIAKTLAPETAPEGAEPEPGPGRAGLDVPSLRLDPDPAAGNNGTVSDIRQSGRAVGSASIQLPGRRAQAETHWLKAQRSQDRLWARSSGYGRRYQRWVLASRRRIDVAGPGDDRRSCPRTG